MTTEYIILIKSRAEDLQKQVLEYLKDGWTLQGGVSVSSFGYTEQGRDYPVEDYTFIQAMIRTT